ncbi:MAG: hypothetical protein JOZ19_12370 [Rubrobacter sp.]|nr:hypothetical protein [Rubrobacter sp.]
MLSACVAHQRILACLGLMLALGSLLLGCGGGGSATAPKESSASQTTATTSESREATSTESTKESSSGSSNQPALSERTPTVTPSGYVIAPGCALWEVEGYFDLFYYPLRPTTICVQPPGSPQAGTQVTSDQAPLPPNCAVSPDGVVYCIVGGILTPDTLRVFYERGELQSPRISGGSQG